jgi:hypothetical protein
VGAQDQSSSGVHRRYDADRLVWFESHDSAEAAMLREKQIKEWKRDWKLTLIERDNPRLDRSLCKSLVLNRANSGMGTRPLFSARGRLRRCDLSSGDLLEPMALRRRHGYRRRGGTAGVDNDDKDDSDR